MRVQKTQYMLTWIKTKVNSTVHKRVQFKLCLLPDRDSDPQHARTSSSPGLSGSSALAHSPSLPRLSGTDCHNTLVTSSRLNVLKSRWSLTSSPPTAPKWYVSKHCMISVWQVISHSVDACPCNDCSVVLCHVRNCPCIIIIIINRQSRQINTYVIQHNNLESGIYITCAYCMSLRQCWEFHRF